MLAETLRLDQNPGLPDIFVRFHLAPPRFRWFKSKRVSAVSESGYR